MKNLIKITLFILFTAAAVTASAVWYDPSSIAPGGNVEPPINNSSVSQIKTGGISVGSLIVSGGATLGDTTTECNATTTGTMRFNGGLLQVCSDTPQLSASGTITTKDPLTPPSCLSGQVAVYEPSGWECSPTPQTLPVCGEGDVLLFSTTTYLWDCAVFEGGKFQDANDPANAQYNSGRVGINTDNPQALLHVNSTNDASVSSIDHSITIGQTAAKNLIIDNDEIMARNNGAIAPMYLQQETGRLSVHNNAAVQTQVHFHEDGRVIIGEGHSGSLLTSGKLLIDNTTQTGPDNWYTSIKFTNDGSNAIWNPAGGNYFGMHSNGTFYWGDESGGIHEKYVMSLNSDSGVLDITSGSLTNSGEVSLNQGYIYMGTGNQLIVGDDNTAFYFDSNGAGSRTRFYDKQGTRYGYIYGADDRFGLLDGDGNWSLRHNHDDYTSFVINNSEKMRIESSGAVGIGTTNPNNAYLLDVYDNTTGYMTRIKNNSTTAGSDLIRIRLGVATPSVNGQWMRFDSGGVARGYVSGNSNSVTFRITSDRRLKKDIKDLSTEDAIDLALRSRPVSFDWKETGLYDVGYIAQELKEVVPNAVTGDEENFEIVPKADGQLTKIPRYLNVSMDTMVPIVHGALIGNISQVELIKSKVENLGIAEVENKVNMQQEQIDLLLNKINK